MEIGTSMLARPARRAFQADRKKTIPAKTAQGAPTPALAHCMKVRVAGPSSWPKRPAQTGTEKIIALPAPKPATARAMASSRPSRSWASRTEPGS